MKRFFCFVCVCGCFSAFFWGCEKSDAITRIKRAGIFKAGVKVDVPGFGYLVGSTGEYEGLEIEIARLIAKELLGDASRIEFVAVTPKSRGQLLDSEEIDAVIATFTITSERKFLFNFSSAYYTDSVTGIVKKDAMYSSFKDLDGKKIGIIFSSTTRDVITIAALEREMQVDFMEFATYIELKSALDSGIIDIFCTDRSILKSYLDDTTEFLPNDFAPQQYGVATKLRDKKLAEYIETLIQRWLSDGTIKNLVDRYNL
ncbi:MAG: transporter substrate-binding domain-containing protein [Spirochaetaceae bacterium]|jgi:putative glutamine transport system substrate-binding protein|nr:transporter substrate-binding domain-containing protein [Spirochaetaceae bacterium]